MYDTDRLYHQSLNERDRLNRLASSNQRKLVYAFTNSAFDITLLGTLATSDLDAFQISFELSLDNAVLLSSFEACCAGINPFRSLPASAAMSQISLPDIVVGKLRATDLGRGLGAAAGLAVAAALPVDGGTAKSLTAEATMLDDRRVGVGAPTRLDEGACRIGTGTGALFVGDLEVDGRLAATVGADADGVGVVAAAAASGCRAVD